MRARWAEALALLTVGSLAWLVQPRLDACGPGFSEAVFRDVHHPDTTWAEVVGGRLGILRPGLPKDHLVVSYRHLMGLPVDPSLWNPPSPQAGDGPSEPYVPAAQQWQKAMVSLPGANTQALDVERTTPSYQWFPNVGDHAIQLALDTLHERGRAHGVSSPEVLAWAKAQDQVFRSTPKEPRIPDPITSPEWLSKDRDYQRAAALFYADRWDEARAAFSAIARDPRSSWRAWGGFLIARCWMRQANLGPDDEASAGWAQARLQLESLLRDPSFSAIHQEAKDYLEYVRYRTEPEAMRAEALEGLVRVQSGPAWLEQLKQAGRRVRETKSGGMAPPGLSARASDLEAWLEVMESERPVTETIETRWAETKAVPWLVAGLAALPADHRLRAELEQAASKVPRSHPAWSSLHWHAIRANLEDAGPGAFSSRLHEAMKERWPAWAENQLRAQGRARTETLAEWTLWMASRVVAIRNDFQEPGEPPILPEGTAKRYGKDPMLLDRGVVETLNLRFPLKTLVALAESSNLPAPLRSDLDQVCWVRALLLDDGEMERRLRPRLDPVVRSAVPKDLQTLPSSTKEFREVQVLMAHPGLSPLVEEGLGRSNYGWVPLTEAVSWGSNWWRLSESKAGPLQPAVPLFLTSQDLKVCESEWVRLRRFSSARHWFGRVVTSYAEAHPDDPAVPWALHRFVRITRNAEGYDEDLSRLGQKAFHLLHRRYPGSPWTKKTPVYY